MTRDISWHILHQITLRLEHIYLYYCKYQICIIILTLCDMDLHILDVQIKHSLRKKDINLEKYLVTHTGLSVYVH